MGQMRRGWRYMDGGGLVKMAASYLCYAYERLMVSQ